MRGAFSVDPHTGEILEGETYEENHSSILDIPNTYDHPSHSLTDDRSGPRWYGTLLKEAGRGSVVWRRDRTHGTSSKSNTSGPRSRDPEEHKRRGKQISHNKLEHYGAAHRLTSHVIFTFSQAIDGWREARSHTEQLARRVRRQLNAPPLLLVEGLGDNPWHERAGFTVPTNDGWHVHGALPAQVEVALLRELWPHGHIYCAERKSGQTDLEAARAIIAHYLAKNITDQVPRRKSGYYRARIAMPEPIRFNAQRLSEIKEAMAQVMHAPASSEWASPAIGWDGPPARVLHWAQAPSFVPDHTPDLTQRRPA